MRNRPAAAAAGLLLFSFCLSAQSIFVLPNPSGQNVTGLSVPALSAIGLNSGIFSAPNAFQVTQSAGGTKFYVVSNTGTNTVTVVSSLLSNVLSSFSFFNGASVAALTPNGNQFLVGSGNTLQVINTQNDNLPAPGGIVLGNVSSSAVDLAVSLDSSRAFVLLNTGAGLSLVTVNLQSLTVINTTAIPGLASAVSVGPNGLVYVGTTNLLLEFDPATLAVRNQIALNGIPGKLYFTPDGKFGLAINQTPVTGTIVLVFDLNAKTLSTAVPSTSPVLTPIVTSNVGGSKLFPIGFTRVLFYSASAQTLYDITLNPSPNAPSIVPFAATASGSVGAVAISNDLPAASNGVTNYLFYVSGNTLSEFNLKANSGAGQTTFTGSAGGLSVTSPAHTSGTPVAILAYGDQQSVPPGGTSAPLVVRVLDTQGNPLGGVSVTFSTSAAGVTLQTPSTTTNNDGLAFTTASVSSAAGSVTVSFSVSGALGGSFTLNVGSGGGVVGGLAIVSGQGSLIREQTITSADNATMTAKLTDANGSPISGATITFTVMAGTGALQCTATAIFCVPSATSLTVTTDSNGMVQADYLAPAVNSFPGIEAATITASTSGGSSVTFFVTAFSAARQPSQVILTPQSDATISGNAGQTVKGAIQVQIVGGAGQALSNVALRILNPPDPTVSPSATCAGTFALSNALGVASCDLALGGRVGSVQIAAELGYLYDYGPFNVTIGPGAPAKVNILQGNNQSGKPGQTLPQALLVQVTDAFNNVLAGTPVTWTVLTAGAVTLSQTSAATDSTGKASTLATIGNFSGTAQVQVSAGSATAIFSITVSVAINGLQIVSGNGQTATVGTQFASALVVKVTTAQGPVPNFPVTFAIASGSGTLSNAKATTDANGNASTFATAGNVAGSLGITASITGFSVTFNLTVSPPGPTNVIFLNAASLQGVNPPVNSVVAAGEIVTMQGAGLAPGVVGVVTANSLVGAQPYTIAGVSVKFNNIPAPMFSVSNVNGVQQVTVQVPFELVGSSSATVNITTPGGGSGTFNVTVQAFAPGVFETTLSGVAHQVVAIRPDGSFASPDNPAHLGETIIIFVTGFGQTVPPLVTNGSGVAGQAIAAPIVAGLNGGGVAVVSAQAVVGLVGVYAIAIQIPLDLTPGVQVPVGVIVYDAAGNPYFAQDTFVAISQ
ncbi:MAG TPA: Ig-like domain-containing protein [Bryobacteraceae bacterium]|nr:Ig-like domain-containing protein [Bryobacteraceae bacterium]